MADIDTPINKTPEDPNFQFDVLRVFRPGILSNHVSFRGASLGSNDAMRRVNLAQARDLDKAVWIRAPRAIFAMAEEAWKNSNCPDDIATDFKAHVLRMQRIMLQAQAHMPPPAPAPGMQPANHAAGPATVPPTELEEQMDKYLDTSEGFKTALKVYYKSVNITTVHGLVGGAQTCAMHITSLQPVATFNTTKTTAFTQFWALLTQPDQHQQLLSKELAQSLKNIDPVVHHKIQRVILDKKLHIVGLEDLRDEIRAPTAGGITDEWITNVLIKDPTQDPAKYHFPWKTQLLNLVGVQRDAPVDLVFAEACKHCLSAKQIQKLNHFEITTTEQFALALADPRIRLAISTGIGSLKNVLATFQSHLVTNGISTGSSSDGTKRSPGGTPAKASLYLHEGNGPPQSYSADDVSGFCDSLNPGLNHMNWFFNYFLLNNNILWALQLVHLYAQPAQNIMEQATTGTPEWHAKNCMSPPGYSKKTDRKTIWPMFNEWVESVIPIGTNDCTQKRIILSCNATAREIINATKDTEEKLNQIYDNLQLGTCLRKLMEMVKATCDDLNIFLDNPLAMQVLSKMANHMGLLFKQNRAASSEKKCNSHGKPKPLTERFPQDVNPQTNIPNSNIISLAKLSKIRDAMKILQTQQVVTNQFAVEQQKSHKRVDHPTEATQQSPSDANDKRNSYQQRRELDAIEKKAFEKEIGFSYFLFETDNKTCKWCLWNRGWLCHKYPTIEFNCNNNHDASTTRAKTAELKQCTSFRKLAGMGHKE